MGLVAVSHNAVTLSKLAIKMIPLSYIDVLVPLRFRRMFAIFACPKISRDHTKVVPCIHALSAGVLPVKLILRDTTVNDELFRFQVNPFMS